VFDSQLTPTKLLEIISAEDRDPSDPGGLSYCDLEREVTPDLTDWFFCPGLGFSSMCSPRSTYMFIDFYICSSLKN